MIPALVALAVLVGVWEAYVALAGVDEVVLPAPHDVARSLVEDRAVLLGDLGVTATEVVLGVLAALVVGALLATALHAVPVLRRATYPLLVVSQAIPVPVLAPVLVLWLGFSLLPKLVIVALVCFFPIVVTTLDALQRVDPDQRKLLRTLGASRWQTFRLAEAPAALPAALSGAKIAVAIASIGAVLAETAGAEDGLGLLITTSTYGLDVARSYAAVVLLMALALTLFALLSFLERRAAPWAHRPSDP